MLDLEHKNYIDLTLTLSNDLDGVTLSKARSLARDGWNASTLELFSHVGTHMDAPLHFAVNPQSIDEIPVQRFISLAWVVNLSGIAESSLITIDDMQPIAKKIQKGHSLILRTDWSKRVGTKSYRDALPRISKELAEWMVEKRIALLGVEPPSIANVNNIREVTEIHTILMQNDILILEGLVNLDKITKEQVTLIALPLKILRGDGAPARVLALE